jgi:hypothetical protein
MIDMEEVAREGAMSLTDAAAFIGTVTGVRPGSTQVWRWAAKGLQTGARLEAFQLGRKWLTTKPAVIRFLQGCRPDADRREAVDRPKPAVAPPCPLLETRPDPHSRKKRIEEARARLSDRGLRFIVV